MLEPTQWMDLESAKTYKVSGRWDAASKQWRSILASGKKKLVDQTRHCSRQGFFVSGTPWCGRIVVGWPATTVTEKSVGET